MISQRSPQVAYRLNMMRQQLGIDQQPTTSAVMTYAEHLQAESEELSLTNLGIDAGDPKPPRKPAIKSLDGGSRDPPRDGFKGAGKGDVVPPPGIEGSPGTSGGSGVCRYCMVYPGWVQAR